MSVYDWHEYDWQEREDRENLAYHILSDEAKDNDSFREALLISFDKDHATNKVLKQPQPVPMVEYWIKYNGLFTAVERTIFKELIEMYGLIAVQNALKHVYSDIIFEDLMDELYRFEHPTLEIPQIKKVQQLIKRKKTNKSSKKGRVIARQ